ncbi:UDP-glycosyltransferase UGT5-like isoform X1 [Bicyclus anynana]|uniref:UDP-glucuronosyltransferase n=1 Tax=Bicyclus anynana TaxID=110368 RepID=A0A6J1NRA7_BICAN|nr:UDP-glycosyltransferase UGT5-like isoform X1 [Bicyclus anynana]
MCCCNSIVVLLTLVLNCCYGYKVLAVFPMPGKSHSILGEGYVRHLLAAGHEVTYITPFPVKDPPSRLRQVDISENFAFMRNILDVRKFMSKELDIQNYFLVHNVMNSMLYDTYRMPVIQKFINDPKEQYDAVVVEWLYSELSAGFSSVFNCPFIWASSMIPHTAVLSLIDGHVNPAYSVDHLSRDYTTTFWDRLYHWYYITKLSYQRWSERDTYNDQFKNVFGEAITRRGHKLPQFDDVIYNGSLMLGNSHPATGDNVALPENYKHIGGYHIKDVIEPLPKDLQKLMDESKDGVIYFSMGSMLKSSEIPDDIKNGLLEVFGVLKQTVIWKLEQVIPNVPKNVHVVTWAPQQSILAHPNCVLFITHGGLLSIMETLNTGVPIIGMPFFADQYLNIARASAKGFGMRLDLDEKAPEKLRVAIKNMVENPSYRQSARKFSAIFKDNIASPGQQLAYWVEYVIRTQGAFHLRSPALQTSWYKKLSLDIFLVLLLGVILSFKLCKSLLVVIKNGSGHKKKTA